MKNGGMKRTSAFCAAALMTVSMAGTCFAGEWKNTDSGKMFVEDGKAVTGMAEIDGENYYFNSKGIMKTGWLKTKSGKKYYFDSDGVMKTGWLKTKSGKYYFGKNGVAVTGVKKIGGSFYFFDDEGVMLTGWQEADGEKYYYCTSGKRAVSRTVNIDGENVKFDKNGKVVKKPAKTDDKKDTEDKSDKDEIYPTEITVIKKEIPLAYHTTANITFSFKPLNTTFREVTYKSSNPEIVSIDDNGKMTANKTGSCYITITSVYDTSISVTVKVTVS